MAPENKDPVVPKGIHNFLTTNKGAQRLSWVAGAAGGVLTALLTATQLRWHHDAHVDFVVCVVVAPVGFVATWLLVRACAWVVDGFKTSGKSDSTPPPQEEMDSAK